MKGDTEYEDIDSERIAWFALFVNSPHRWSSELVFRDGVSQVRI
jgi:hypothetical protein